ncbi:MAG TPA: glycoside hydrolase family 172 protein [Fimbriimonadaceae bacterium]|nr:glycoside hydrolase family 172 protein [Fimbriimonadaceae bacterium]
MVPLVFLAVLARPAVTLDSLLREMASLEALARYPDYQALQATSYNRESVRWDRPGWFADSDGTGYTREESIDGKTEWVIMEHQGPGCITRMWTPYFYYDLNDHTGPNVRIYLDGEAKPVIDESLIQLVQGKGSIEPPFARPTARAGVCALPIPFAKSCKVTMTAKPFYYSVGYRAYPTGTAVRSFSTTRYRQAKAALDAASKAFDAASRFAGRSGGTIPPGAHLRVSYSRDAPGGALTGFRLEIPEARVHPDILRSLILVLRFDGEETVWCPVGDFFSCPDSLHPFRTMQRQVTEDGTLTCRWVMPFRRLAEIDLLNLSKWTVKDTLSASIEPWKWDDQTMLFHAAWQPDDIVPGTPFQDWNFVDIRGKGVYVGDSWMVLNMQPNTWWGEGDEKVYVDDAWDKGFPTQFGTGSEDYYGWAGGVLPTRQDEFSMPFGANVRVGGLDGHTLGYNVNTRTRGLDAIPFSKRLRFDMESSFGVDIRNPWNLLGYSVATFWYARPGSTSNREPEPKAAAKPVVSLADLQKRSAAIRGGQ